MLAAELVIAERLKEIVGDRKATCGFTNRSRNTRRCASAGRRSFGSSREPKKPSPKLIRFCRRENLPLFVIGRGSNLLVRDGGIRGVVVHPCGGEFDQVERARTRNHRGRRREAEASRLRGQSRRDSAAWNGWKEFRARSAAACG